MEPLGLLSVMKLPTDSMIKVSLILFDVVLCSYLILNINIEHLTHVL